MSTERTLYKHVMGYRLDNKGIARRMPIATVAAHRLQIGNQEPSYGLGITFCSYLDAPSRKIGRACLMLPNRQCNV